MIQIDMEMPEKCGLCPLFHAEHPMHCQGVKADRKKKIVAPYGQPKPDWCPLHKVTADHDTISRKQAIEPFMDNSDDWVSYDVRKILESLPPSPSRPQGRWIPCSERLPEDNTEVFVYLFDHHSPYIAWVVDSRWYTEEFEIEIENEPIAWMPLPKPYREGAEYEGGAV